MCIYVFYIVYICLCIVFNCILLRLFVYVLRFILSSCKRNLTNMCCTSSVIFCIKNCWILQAVLFLVTLGVQICHLRSKYSISTFSCWCQHEGTLLVRPIGTTCLWIHFCQHNPGLESDAWLDAIKGFCASKHQFNSEVLRELQLVL